MTVDEIALQLNQLNIELKELQLQKDSLLQKLKDRDKDHDILKEKFSGLLDQFEDYIGAQEKEKDASLLLVEEEKQTWLTDMQAQIQKMEEVIEALKNELQ